MQVSFDSPWLIVKKLFTDEAVANSFLEFAVMDYYPSMPMEYGKFIRILQKCLDYNGMSYSDITNDYEAVIQEILENIEITKGDAYSLYITLLLAENIKKHKIGVLVRNAITDILE